MEAFLTEQWLGRADVVLVIDDAAVSVARERAREVGRTHGVSAETVDEIMLVVSELARNQLEHTKGGGIVVSPIARAGVLGLEVIAADRGPGLAAPAAALEGAPRSRGSLGVGLAGVCRIADEVDFDVRVGEGTTIRARKFDAEVPRRRSVGIYGRPLAGERVSGDAAGFLRDAAGLTLGVCDGLGHGEPAQVASRAAMEAFARSGSARPPAILEDAHAALRRTRGAVMSVARIDETQDRIEIAAVGNVETEICAPRAARRFGGSSFFLGSPARGRSAVRAEIASIAPHECLVMFTDGIRAQLVLERELDLLRERPVIMAARIVERFARGRDDALVLVAR